MRFVRRWVIIPLVFLISILIWYGYLRHIVTLDWIKQQAEALKLLADAHYYRAVILYILSYTTLIALGFPVAAFLSIPGGFLFGAVEGAVYAVIGATLGSFISFVLVRYYIGSFFQKRYKKRLAFFNEQMERYGISYLLIIHYLSVIPFFVINSLAALTLVSFWDFIWTTIVGFIPMALIYSFAGSRLHLIESIRDIFSPHIILLLLFLIFMALVPLIIRRYMGTYKKI